MNRLLLDNGDLLDAHTAIVRDRRHRHLVDIKGCGIGSSLPAGYLDGPVGTATVTAQTDDETRLSLHLNDLPPPPLPLTLVLALPRPKMLRRILRAVAELGIKELYLINSFKVEKSYWQSPLLNDNAIREAFIAGLEQAGDSMLPHCHLRRRFRPFVEDELSALCADRRAVLADIDGRQAWPRNREQAATLVVGPEGGFTPFERDLLIAQGLATCSLGPRIHRVETVIPLLANTLFSLP